MSALLIGRRSLGALILFWNIIGYFFKKVKRVSGYQNRSGEANRGNSALENHHLFAVVPQKQQHRFIEALNNSFELKAVLNNYGNIQLFLAALT